MRTTPPRTNPFWNRPTPKKPPSVDDQIQAKIVADVSAAIVEALRPLITQNPSRMLRTLTADEVNVVSVKAVSAYILSRNRSDKHYGLRVELSDPIDDLFTA